MNIQSQSSLNKFLSEQPLKMHIGGQWTNGAGGKTFVTVNPGTGEQLAVVAAGDATDVDRAVEAARKAFNHTGWSRLEANDRAVLIHRLADLIDKHADVLSEIESLDVGKPLAQAQATLPRSA